MTHWVSHFCFFFTLKSDPRDLWPLRHWWQFLMTIVDDNCWWQFLMTIFYDNFLIKKDLKTIFYDNLWWQLLMTIFDDNCWWQLLMTIVDDNCWFSDFWKVFRFLENFQIFGKFLNFLKVFRFFGIFCDLRLDTWDTDYISDNWEQQYEQLHCDLWIQSDGDSIRNSCDVLKTYSNNLDQKRQNHTSFFCLDFSTLRFQMSPQMLCPRRGKVTLAALVWFFSTVYFQMSPQSASIRGCKVTLVAFV